MRICPETKESGGVLLELVIFAFLMVFFAAGATGIHAALGRRFAAIVGARNEGIRHARGVAAQHLPENGQPAAPDFGGGWAGRLTGE